MKKKTKKQKKNTRKHKNEHKWKKLVLRNFYCSKLSREIDSVE